MFSLSRFSVDLVELIASGFVEKHVGRRRLVKQEAISLIETSGPAAFEAAQQVALLARQRGDGKARKLWLDIANEIARREVKGLR